MIFNKKFKTETNAIHSIHPYPACFPAFVPAKLIQEFGKDSKTLLDPFCGGGTALVEGIVKGLDVIGNDVNSIALLISEVKTTEYNAGDIKKAILAINKMKTSFEKNIFPKQRTVFEGIDHWFDKNIQKELDLVKDVIFSLKEGKLKKLLCLVLSNIMIEVSNQESDTRYAYKEKNLSKGFVIDIFESRFKYITDKITDFNATNKIKGKTRLLSEDARLLSSISDNFVDLIITSPPYANTYDYYLYHKQRMNWLGFDYKTVQNMEIGSRREFSSLKKHSSKWEQDVSLFLSSMKRVLRPKKHMCLLIGDSVIAGELINIDKLVVGMASKQNLKIDHIESVSLLENSKRFNQRFRTPKDKKEHLIIIRK